MAYFGMVRVNGLARFPSGSTGGPSIGFTNDPKTGIYSQAAGRVNVVAQGAHVLLIDGNGPSAFQYRLGQTPDSPDTTITREAANTVKFFDGSTTASTVLLGAVDFRQTASTFAQTATITNGPRAANPVAWVEVKVSGSTGRIPVW